MVTYNGVELPEEQVHGVMTCSPPHLCPPFHIVPPPHLCPPFHIVPPPHLCPPFHMSPPPTCVLLSTLHIVLAPPPHLYPPLFPSLSPQPSPPAMRGDVGTRLGDLGFTFLASLDSLGFFIFCVQHFIMQIRFLKKKIIQILKKSI